MIINTLKNHILISGAILAFLCAGCNKIPDTVTQDETIFIHDKSEKVFRIDSLFIFNLRKDYIVNFSGKDVCSLAVDDSIISVSNDSLYLRITCYGDTMFDVGDSTYGTAAFLANDVAKWSVLLTNLKDTNCFLGKTITAQLSASEIEIIQSTVSDISLPESLKTNVVAILDNLLDSTAFYLNHRLEIKRDIYFIPVKDSLNQEVKRMVASSIMLDTTGVVKPALTSYEQEKLRWFYWDLFAEFIDNEAANEDVGKALQRYSSCGRIYTMLFQQGSSEALVNQKEVVRFFEIKHTGMSQLAYSDQYGFKILSDVTISDYPVMTDTSLNVTPFFMVPKTPFVSGRDFLSLVVSGKSVIAYNSMFFGNSDTTVYYTANFYYPLSGQRLYNGKPVSMVGTVSQSTRVYKVKGYNTQRDQGYFTDWRTESNIQMVSTSGKRTRYKNCSYLQSDDGP